MYQPFKADLPQWVPMGDDDQSEQIGQSTGSFVDALKKRMAGGKAPNGNLPYEGNGMPTGAGGMATGSGGGGMKSL